MRVQSYQSKGAVVKYIVTTMLYVIFYACQQILPKALSIGLTHWRCDGTICKTLSQLHSSHEKNI